MRAFIIGRPYHLFNAINFVNTFHVEGDAFILNDYKNALRDYEKLKIANIFRKVFFVEDESIRNKSFINNIFYIIKRAIFPMRFVIDNIPHSKISIKDVLEYDIIYSATPNSFVLALLDVTKSDYYVIEDGASTYTGKDFLQNHSFKHKIYCKIFKKGMENIKVKGVYVYSPKICKSLISNNILQLPTINANDKILLDDYNKVFLTKNEKYRRNFIFLSQRLLGFKNLNFSLIDFVSEIFKDAKIKNYCYRLHPSEVVENLPINDTNMLPNDMWELLCYEYVQSETVLMTINSTAAFSPYKLYKKEPYLIFIYKVVGLSGTDLEISESLVKTLVENYKEPSKIFVPKDKEEVVNILKEINDIINHG